MAGSSLDTFTDFMTTTGPAIFSGPEEMVNEATKHTYALERFLTGEMSRRIQGGSTIKDQIFFDEASTFQDYLPNDAFAYDNPQVLDEWEVRWRFSTAHMSWTDQEVGLQTGEMSQPARFHKYKSLKDSKERNLWTSILNGLEDQLWASPDAAQMESAGGRTPYSIGALVNEYSSVELDFTVSTSAPSRAVHDGYDPVWGATAQTVQGINPSTQTKWQNHKETYDSVNAQANANNQHLFVAFDHMFKKLRFDRLPIYANYGTETKNPGFIACSRAGSVQYENALRVNQDWFRYGGQDPAYPYPKYRNIDVVYIDSLGTANLYADPAGTAGYGPEDNVPGTGVAAEAVGFDGPRYYWLNGQFMKKTIHRDRYFHKKAPFSPSAQPYTKVMPVDIWHNNHATSRRRHGIIVPLGAIGDAA